MRFDSQGRVYWNSLTPQQKFEWDYLGIDPTEAKPRVVNGVFYCQHCFEPYPKGESCKKNHDTNSQK